MAEQTEKAFLKQPKVFLCSKKSGKGKPPGKGGNRDFKNIGLGFKTPREAIEGPEEVAEFEQNQQRVKNPFCAINLFIQDKLRDGGRLC